MVSEYLEHNRTIEELDALFEQDRIAAAKIAVVALNHEVTTAVTNISEIHQVANARIFADGQIASAKLMTDAEITATHLIAKAELAVIDVRMRDQNSTKLSDLHVAMISEIGRTTAEGISQNAQESIQAIQNDAAEAIALLKQNASNAISMIQNLSTEISQRIDLSAKRAQEKLEQSKLHHRTAEELIVEAESQKALIAEAAKASSQDLQRCVEDSISNLHAATDAASAAISEAVTTSRQRILAARDKALVRIYEIVGPPSPSTKPS